MRVPSLLHQETKEGSQGGMAAVVDSEEPQAATAELVVKVEKVVRTVKEVMVKVAEQVGGEAEGPPRGALHGPQERPAAPGHTA